MLDIDADTVGIRMEAHIDLDVTRFDGCCIDDGCGAETAVELYHGDLLEGLGHDCFAAERERLADRFEDALAIVAQRRLEEGDLGAPTRQPIGRSHATRCERRPMPS